jgi:hypothetical protein
MQESVLAQSKYTCSISEHTLVTSRIPQTCSMLHLFYTTCCEIRQACIENKHTTCDLHPTQVSPPPPIM